MKVSYQAERAWSGLWIAVTDSNFDGAVMQASWSRVAPGDRIDVGGRHQRFQHKSKRSIRDLDSAVTAVEYLVRMIRQGRMEPYQRG